MSVHSEFVGIVLAPREVFVPDTSGSVEIAVRIGCVWLTQAGDRRDVVLLPGQSFAVPRAADVVVTSRAGAELVVTPAKPAASGGHRREWMRLAAAFVHRSFSRVAHHGARRSLAARLQLGPPAGTRMD